MSSYDDRSGDRSCRGPVTDPGGSGLVANVQLDRDSFRLDVTLAASPGEVVAVLGPNGAGKSTLLGVLAGLTMPASGTVRLGGRELTGPGVLVPPEHRRVALMGQDPLLFPHLSATKNIAFGPRSQGMPRRQAQASASAWLARLGLAEYSSRRPAGLSGGQRQRVALARALAAEPELLLLDEPLGALDARTAPEVRQVLRRHVRATGTTTILVTHDIVDAATLADRVVVLAAGSVTDDGPTAQVLAAPRSEFSAALAGLNLLRATADSGAAAGSHMAAQLPGGLRIRGIASGDVSAGAEVSAVFSPSAVAVYLDLPSGSPRNTWSATVVELAPGQSAIRVTAECDDAHVRVAADVTAASAAELGLHPGSRVQLSVKATEVRVHARDS